MSKEISEAGGLQAGAIHSRLVLNFPGFENIGTEACLDRLFHCAEKTGDVFKFAVTPTGTSETDGSSHAIREFDTCGEGWEVRSRVVQFDWYDIVESYENQTFPIGFIRNLRKYLVIFHDGTLRRYLNASRLYFIFSIYPILLMFLFALLAAAVANFGVQSLGLSGVTGLIAGVASWAVLWLVLCRWPGDFLFLNTTVSNWGFAWDLTNRRNALIADRMAKFGDVVAKEIKASKQDEVVICGHSLGCVWAISALSLALEKNPDLLEGKQVGFLSLGSSHLKIALCEEAGWLREHLRSVLDEPTVYWHEFQSKDDVIAFYKAHPFSPIEIADFAARCKVDRVRFKRGMSLKRYRAMKRSLYFTHNQYVRYYEKPVSFDFYIRLFGPISVSELADNPDLIFQLSGTDEHMAAAG